MREIWNFIQICISAAGAFFGWFLGGNDGFFYALIAFVIIDYITGVINALLLKSLSSEIGFKGICKKALIFALVGIANFIDLFVLKEGCVLRTAIIFFYIANEGISILENVSKIGLPIPQKLKDVLAQINKRSEE